jgi:hypothetical protein
MVPLRTLPTSVNVAGGDVTGETDPDWISFDAVNPLYEKAVKVFAIEKDVPVKTTGVGLAVKSVSTLSGIMV